MFDAAEQRVRTALDCKLTWLTHAALPLWASDGVDPRGGFYERIDQQGRPITDLPRRARVVARQTYVFATAHERGWGDYSTQTAHGLKAIFDNCLLDNGLSLSTYAASGDRLLCEFDSYDQAFVLFALATVARVFPAYHDKASAAGERLLTAMRERFRHPEVGFEEAQPRRTPLLQNPHMHLLEACLAFDMVQGSSQIWRDQARELVMLVERHLTDRSTGAIHEYFGGDWQPIIDAEGGWVEPGHQFEWAWLLWQWHGRTNDPRADTIAQRLYQIGTDHGRTTSGQVIDAIDSRHKPRARTLRLWPQTERLKACMTVAERVSGDDQVTALNNSIETLSCLSPYLATSVPGLWFDRLDECEQPLVEAAPASSLYHIVCAFDHAEQAMLRLQRS